MMEEEFRPSKLIALHDYISPTEYIIENDVCTLGRYSKCQVIISRNTVSRLHAKIERDGPRYLLYDTNSANGTFVNGDRIYEPHLLMDQDLIGLSNGSALLRFEDADPTAIFLPRLLYNRPTMTFLFDQKPLDLTPSQFRLLRHLYLHTGSVCTRESCAEAIWGRDYDPGLDADALNRAVSNLRQQLRQFDPKADMIETRPGFGYMLNL